MHRPHAVESFRRPVTSLACALGLLAGLCGPSPARAESDLRLEMGAVAKQIKLLLDQKGMDAIAVGAFRCPTKPASSAGPAICKALTDNLKAVGIGVKRQASFEVSGEYRDVEDSKTKLTAVQIKAHVVDRNGTEVVAFEPRGIFNLTTIASLVGLTVEIPADATDKERNEKLNDAIDNPKVNISNTRIAASADSPYALEVLVKSDGEYRPRAASKDDDGLAFLKIQREEAYELRLINDSPCDAAVTLTIDGLSVFAFSEGAGYTHFIVPSKTTLIVPGWHRTNKLSDSFLVTEYAKSLVAEKLPSSSSVGTITASFAAAWARDDSPPEDEVSAKQGERSGDATGKGPPVGTSFVEVDRSIGRLRASVSVRYTKDDAPNDLPNSKP